jgi:hypothetical protein
MLCLTRGAWLFARPGLIFVLDDLVYAIKSMSICRKLPSYSAVTKKETPHAAGLVARVRGRWVVLRHGGLALRCRLGSALGGLGLGEAPLSGGGLVLHGDAVTGGRGSPLGRGLVVDDGAVGGAAALVGVDAGADEEDELDEPEEQGEDGGGLGEGAAAAEPGVRVELRVVVVVVAARGAAAARLTVVDGDEDGALEGDDPGGGEPDEQGDGDMGAGVDAGLELADDAGDALGEGPDDAGDGLRRASAGV